MKNTKAEYLLIITDFLEQEQWEVSLTSKEDTYLYFDFMNDSKWVIDLIKKGDSQVGHIKYKLIKMNAS